METRSKSSPRTARWEFKNNGEVQKTENAKMDKSSLGIPRGARPHPDPSPAGQGNALIQTPDAGIWFCVAGVPPSRLAPPGATFLKKIAPGGGGSFCDLHNRGLRGTTH